MRPPSGPRDASEAPPAVTPGEDLPLDRADRLDSWKQIAAHLGRSVLTAQRWEKKEGLPVRRHTHEKQDSVYAFKSELDRWWHDRGVARPARDLEQSPEPAAPISTRWQIPRTVSTRLILVSAASAVLLVALAAWRVRAAKVRWARQEALPKIEEVMRSSYSSSTLFLAYRLAADARRYIPADTQLGRLWLATSRPIDIASEPPGADVSLGAYDGSATLSYGVSPQRGTRVARGFLHWVASKNGYEPVEGMLYPWIDSLRIVLDRTTAVPSGMVRATGGRFEMDLVHLGEQPGFELPDYWIDKYEVTNREFRQFVNAGGYSDARYWKQPFTKDGHELSFAEAMTLFRDRTGRPAPATWEAGDYPQERADYPVTGVSWFEAMAYAEFAGKSLPTVFHWMRAAGMPAYNEIVPLSNLSGSDLARVGTYHSMNAVGVYDMAGNAKEWCFNATPQGRFILGGAWDEPLYMFSSPDGQSPFSRADNYGFRLVKYIAPPAPSLLRAIDYPRRDFSKERPVSNAVFEEIRSLYTYDKSPLHVTVDSVDDSDERWREETVSFDAAYGGERVSARVYLPRHAQPPYQTVVFFPGSGAIQDRSSRQVRPPLGGATIKTGRALVYPIYKGTHQRGDALDTDYPKQTALYREHVVDWYQDLERTLDYLETRPDVDASRFAYYGFSWGARLGPLFLALDSRIKTAVLVAGGLKFAATFSDVDPFNFASRVTVPVLMINGQYDYFFPLETSQEPLFRLLGTRARDKRHVVVPAAGHAPPVTPITKDVLEWLDRYLGPVSAAKP